MLSVMPDPTDSEIEGRLRAMPPDVFVRLGRAMNNVRRADPATLPTWTPSRVLEDGAHTFPYPNYSADVDELQQVLYTAGLVVPFDWMHWKGIKRYKTKEDLAGASVADAVRFTTSVVRGERFCDGAIQQHLDDGTLLAAIEVIYAWLTADRSTRITPSE